MASLWISSSAVPSQGLEIVDGHAVKAPGDYENPDHLYDMLIARIRKYHPSTDVSMIKRAYDLAQEAHGDQCFISCHS